MADYNNDDFIILYPGVYTERELPLVKKYLEECEAINKRGPVDVQALVEGRLPRDTPGLGPVIPVTEAMVRYNNGKYDPENPLYNDRDYARDMGYEDIQAFFTFGAHDDTYTKPYPPEARDTLLVSQLSHSVDALAPIYPGDTLYLVHDKRSMTDLTPAGGDIHRTLALHAEGSIYNQKGELVNTVEFNVTESVRIFKEGLRPEHMEFPQIWEAPDWNQRPAHYYTDEDYEYIRSVLRAETRQGHEPLYWEDVSVGDMPVMTADGPIIESVLPTAPYGQGIGGTRTMKKELLDADIFKTMIKRPEDGIYVLPDKAAYTPAIPEGAEVVMLFDDGRRTDDEENENAVDTSDIHAQQGDTRAAIINFCGRDMAIRHIHNWIGDHGVIRNIKWSIMCPETHSAYGKPVPENPYFRRFINKVPQLQGKTVNTHGLTKDMAFVQSYVTDKYVENGVFMVRLVWWIEEIEHNIWIEGSAEVQLPSRCGTL